MTIAVALSDRGLVWPRCQDFVAFPMARTLPDLTEVAGWQDGPQVIQRLADIERADCC